MKTTLIAEPGSHSMTMIRTFSAPKALVFRAYTDPEAIPRWWGPEGLETVVDRMDARDGGSWRFVQRDQAGAEFAFHGVYHSVTMDQIVHTFEWEGMPGHVFMETVYLEEQDGKTTLRDLSVFQSVEDRDGMLQTGAADGADQSMNRLEAYLKRV